MISVYESLICDLKIKLKNRNIKFNKVVSLINNRKYDEIIIIINDETIHTLIQNIETERIRIGNSMENKLNNLVWLNERLIQFGEEPQPSKTKALKSLKEKVFINIYDLEAERYERTTCLLLKKQLRKHPEKRFPLYAAKENITLKCFLIKM